MIKEIKPLLKSKFIYLWISQILSQVSVNIMNFLLLTKLFIETKSTMATSLLWVFYALPLIIIGPIASAIVDLKERKKILIITNLLQSVCILLFALYFKGEIFSIFSVVIAYSVLNQFYLPAEAAFLPAVVKIEKLALANSLFFITQQASVILGFGLAGYLNMIIGFRNSFILCSIFLFAAFLSVYFLPSVKRIEKDRHSFEDAFFEFFKRILQGYRFIKSEKTVFMPFVLLAYFQIVLAIIMINVPLIAHEVIRIPVNSAGLFIIAPAALGAITGSLLIQILIKYTWRKKRIIEFSLVLLCFSIFILSMFNFNGQSVLKYIVSSLSIMIIGISFVGIVIPSQTLIQEKTPESYRGRVFGNFSFIVTLVTIFPVLFSGAVSGLLGIRAFLLILAINGSIMWYLSVTYGDRLIQKTKI